MKEPPKRQGVDPKSLSDEELIRQLKEGVRAIEAMWNDKARGIVAAFRSRQTGKSPPPMSVVARAHFVEFLDLELEDLAEHVLDLYDDHSLSEVMRILGEPQDRVEQLKREAISARDQLV